MNHRKHLVLCHILLNRLFKNKVWVNTFWDVNMCNTAGQYVALRFTLQSLQAEWTHHLFFSHAVFQSNKKSITSAKTSSLACRQSRHTERNMAFFQLKLLSRKSHRHLHTISLFLFNVIFLHIFYSCQSLSQSFTHPQPGSALKFLPSTRQFFIDTVASGGMLGLCHLKWKLSFSVKCKDDCNLQASVNIQTAQATFTENRN